MKVTTDACLFGAWCAHELMTTDIQTLLDIGTGTGLLPLLLSQKKAVTIDAIEIDAAAATQAQQNIEASPWKETISVHNDDVLNMGFLKSYDCIISNPPFYEKDLQSSDEKRNMAHHSKQLPLQALIQFTAKRLNRDGLFFLLLPYKRRNEITAILNDCDLFINKEILVRQTVNHSPFRLMLKGGFRNTACETSTITIALSTQQYTPEFTELLKDYYLYL